MATDFWDEHHILYKQVVNSTSMFNDLERLRYLYPAPALKVMRLMTFHVPRKTFSTYN